MGDSPKTKQSKIRENVNGIINAAIGS